MYNIKLYYAHGIIQEFKYLNESDFYSITDWSKSDTTFPYEFIYGNDLYILQKDILCFIKADLPTSYKTNE